MSITILSISLTGTEPEEAFACLYGRLPEALRERYAQYKAPGEQQRRIAGKGLLMKALKDRSIAPEAALEQLRYTANHQPYLEDPDIRFSISHSDDLIVCAVSGEASVGIDVEKIKPVKLSLVRAYLDEQSWNDILDADDPETVFFRHWTTREAVIKASGLGLEQADLAAMTSTATTIQLMGRVFYYKMLSLAPSHSACVASDQPIDGIEIITLTVQDLL